MDLRIRSSLFLLLLAAHWCGSALALTVTRGPYLQMGTDSGMIIRWRTDTSSDSVVRYGSSPGALNQLVSESGDTTEHEVVLSGLSPSTVYYYSVGTSGQTLQGGDSSYRFRTSPVPGTSSPTRIWLIGDSGTANSNAAAVYDAYLNFPGAENTDLWLMLGDNAYNDGTDSQYQSAVFDMYPELLRRVPLWPTLGNHDGHSADSATESGPYYQIFSLPKNAEAGGLASGTEAYYSFDFGDIHFICLDSYDSSRDPGSAMMTWLQNDLVVTDKNWIIAFWHHPPYTKGSHDSDTESALIDMRQNALPILENYGVDLVFSGHSHSYERSYLIDGHYGASNTFNASYQIDGGDGREDGNGAYQKNASTSHTGAVYTVAGSSGKTSGGSLNHPAMYTSLNQLGSVVLDVNGNRLDAKFLNSAGSITDYFTLIKGADTQPPVLTSASATSATQVQVVFSETVDTATAQDTANYLIDGGIAVSDASVSANTVTLSTSALSTEVTYTLTVNGVEDSSGNAIAPDSQITFSYQNVQADSFQNGVNGYAGTEDTWIGSGVPDSNFGNDAGLLADGSDGSNGETASLVKWDVSTIPAGSTVTDAQIEFEVFGVSAGEYDLYAGNVAWSEGTATWNTVDPYANRGVKVGSFVPASSGRHTIPLNSAGRAMVQGWVDGSSNHGVFVMTGGTSDGLDMRSSEYGNASLRPRLLMTYVSGASENAAPSAAFSFSSVDLNVDFSDASTDSDGTLAGWSWDFGDGTSSNVQNPSHTYSSAGTYSVTLTVTDDRGATDSVIQNVNVSASPDTVAPSRPSGLTASGVTTTSLLLSWTASTDNVGVAGYLVRRGGVQVGDVSTTSFMDNGLNSNTTYGYTVEAYDAVGNFSGQSASESFTTANDPPTAGFDVTIDQLTVTLSDMSTDSDGTVVDWQWDFGDGSASTLQNPVHAYAAGGTYTINLVVTDNDGGLGSTSQSVMVSDGSEPLTVDLQEGLNGYHGVEDTYVASGRVTDNWGSSPAILADGDDGRNDELISLLKRDVSPIPAGAVVTDVSITLQVFNRSNNVYTLSEMLAAWNESSATWNTTQPPANTGAQIGSFTPNSTGEYTISLNADGVALVQSWVDGASNNGLMIRSGGTRNGVDMRSSEYGTQPLRPKLTITFQ